jgi:glycerophosphoryl diester phosphodiesterase
MGSRQTPPPVRPAILGHRGASAQAPENTLAAFRLAMAQGADGVELDARRCASGEVVVFHDQDALRIAGAPLRVAEVPLDVLRELDAGAWKGAGFRGERIPLLAEVLEALPGARVNVELKAERRDRRLAGAAAEVIRRAGASGRVIASSFDAGLLAAFQRAAPEVACGLLVDRRAGWRLLAELALWRLRPEAVHPEHGLATAAQVGRWRARGLAVSVWTVDEPAEARRLAGLGVDSLITNRPGELRRLLDPGPPRGPYSSRVK